MACDYKTSVSLEGKSKYSLIPRYSGFEKTSMYLHEAIGWYAYRLKGYIKN